MIRLILTNQHVTIKNADRKTIAALENATSYRVAGAYFSQAFRMKRWDGREHLMSFSATTGYRAPIGLLEDIVSTLKESKIPYKINTKNKRKQTEFIQYDWNESIKMRSYQKKAVRKITKDGILKGVGILNLAIRSGKTKTAARIAYELQAKTLFVVTAKTLLYQSKKSLEESLNTEVGIIGDGVWEEKDVTVAMAQTLSQARGGWRVTVSPKSGRKTKKLIKTDPRFENLIGKYDLIVFDECHHLTSDLWHTAMLEFDAPYRVGLSATVYFDKKSEYEKGVIWLKACCGNIRHRVKTSYLIEKGWLVRPLIKLYHMAVPTGMEEKRWSQSLHKECIFLNRRRNSKICKLAKKYVAKGQRVLIVTSRLDQVAAIRIQLEQMDVNHDAVTGATPLNERESKMEAFSSKECPVLVGTVFKEGVDIPEVEVVINAEGGKDVKMTVQKMRNLTPSDGKKKAVYIDFYDTMNPYFETHSKSRLKTYESESAFVIKHVR